MYLNRRNFLKACVLTGAAIGLPPISEHWNPAEAKEEVTMNYPEHMQVPYSTGREKPSIQIPAGACDCAHHIYDPVRFPYVPTDVRNQPPAGVDVYRMLQHRLGLEKSVVIQPSAYGTDNRCLLDAIRQLGKDKSCGVAVVADDVTDRELSVLAEGGVKGIRYNVSRGKVFETKNVRRMADRLKELGWHLDFWMPADLTAELGAFLKTLPVPLVFDHRGHLPQGVGTKHPAFRVITELMQEGKAYVKLSALYHDSSLEDDYADTVAVGKAYVAAAPTQVLWGTDWPHPSEFSAKRDMPDDAHLLDLLAVQAATETVRHQILVENPARLYGL